MISTNIIHKGFMNRLPMLPECYSEVQSHSCRLYVTAVSITKKRLACLTSCGWDTAVSVTDDTWEENVSSQSFAFDSLFWMAVCVFAFELNECDLESDLGRRLGLASALTLAIFKMLPQYHVNLLEFPKVKFVKSKWDDKQKETRRTGCPTCFHL